MLEINQMKARKLGAYKLNLMALNPPFFTILVVKVRILIVIWLYQLSICITIQY